MNWFSENKFLAGVLVFFVAGAVGAGYYLTTRLSGYREAMENFELKRSRIAALQRKQLYPSESNVRLIEESVTRYEGEVTKLQQELLRFQKPLNTSMRDTEFQQLVKERVAAVQKLAESAGVVLPEGFYMGLVKYRLDVPEPASVALLDYQLKAVERLMEAVVRSGIEQVIALDREPLAVEASDYKAPDAARVLEKYPIQLTMSGKHEAVRRFFNEISNDTEYFFNIRFFRIENSAKTGPERGVPGEAAAPGEADPAAPAADEGADEENLNRDAQIVMGSETIEVLAVIDLVRFVEIK